MIAGLLKEASVILGIISFDTLSILESVQDSFMDAFLAGPTSAMLDGKARSDYSWFMAGNTSADNTCASRQDGPVRSEIIITQCPDPKDTGAGSNYIEEVESTEIPENAPAVQGNTAAIGPVSDGPNPKPPEQRRESESQHFSIQLDLGDDQTWMDFVYGSSGLKEFTNKEEDYELLTARRPHSDDGLLRPLFIDSLGPLMETLEPSEAAGDNMSNAATFGAGSSLPSDAMARSSEAEPPSHLGSSASEQLPPSSSFGNNSSRGPGMSISVNPPSSPPPGFPLSSVAESQLNALESSARPRGPSPVIFFRPREFASAVRNGEKVLRNRRVTWVESEKEAEELAKHRPVVGSGKKKRVGLGR